MSQIYRLSIEFMTIYFAQSPRFYHIFKVPLLIVSMFVNGVKPTMALQVTLRNELFELTYDVIIIESIPELMMQILL